jgi:predicted amidohydrolase YtcJ
MVIKFLNLERKDFMNRKTVTTGLLLFLITAVLTVSLQAQGKSPDVIYYNARIATFDANNTFTEAVAVSDGKIFKTGSSADIMKLAGSGTKLVDLGGRTVLPGFIDGHTHPLETIMMKDTWVDCRYPGCPSVAQALKNIKKWVKNTPKGVWISCACVSASENKFAEKRLPTLAELDRVAPNNPVLMMNGAHMAIVNSCSLKALGIKKGMKMLPHGGQVILDKNGNPTGVLTDVQGDIPYHLTPQEMEKYYTKEIQKFWNSNGFTSVLAITPSVALPVLQKVAQSKYRPTLRYLISVWTSANGKDMPDSVDGFTMPEGSDPSWYKFIAIKGFVDGENDCRTGYMYEPYVGHQAIDPPGGRGALVMNQNDADSFVHKANKNGVICMLHCTGDAAIDIGLNAYKDMIKSGKPANIFRIEHLGMFQLNNEILQKAKDLKKYGLHISLQPVWLQELLKADYENMRKSVASTGFKYKTLIDAGLEPAAGSDVTGIYLVNINPFLGISAAVTRLSDMGLFAPEEAISVEDAVKMWTVWSAKAAGEFDIKGSIEPGKYADMIVISGDIFTMPKKKIKDIKVMKTIVGGNVVYEAKDAH